MLDPISWGSLYLLQLNGDQRLHRHIRVMLPMMFIFGHHLYGSTSYFVNGTAQQEVAFAATLLRGTAH